MVLLQLFLNGLQLGAIYALTAVGFSLIFGSTKICLLYTSPSPRDS